MDQRIQHVSFTDGEVGVTLGDNYRYTTTMFDMTIVAVVASPNVDDPGLTVDINDDGTGVITGVDGSDKDVPGTWKSTHIGGTNTPVFVAAGSKLSLDANSAAANTVVRVDIYYLLGMVSA